MTEKRFSVNDFIKTCHSHIIDEKKEIITLEEYVNYLNEIVDENEFLKNKITSLNNLLLTGSSKDNVNEIIYQKYVWYTNFYDDLTHSEKLLIAKFSDFLIESLFESLKEMETEE